MIKMFPRPQSRVLLPRKRPAASPSPAVFECLENRRMFAVSIDQQGWTNVTPSADSRVIYVSSSAGSDTNDGLSADTPVKTVARGRSMLRNNSPDWLLLKRGDVWFERYGLLNLSGRSQQEPILISAYGTGDRPLLNTRNEFAITTNITAVNHVAIIGIRFNSNTNDPKSPDFTNTAAGYGFYGVAPVNDLLIEDCLFEYYSTNLLFQNTQGAVTDISVRRNIVVDSSGGRSQGTYVNGVNGIVFEENLFDHNGWSEENAGDPATIYNHNLYMSARNTGVVLRGNIFSNASSHGLQARAGGIVENNLFLKNPIGLVFGNGSSFTAGGVEGRVSNNVFMEGRDINGNPRGYAVELGNTKPGAGTTLDGNLFAHDGRRSSFAAIKLSMGAPPSNLPDAVGLNDLTVRGNIVYDWYQALSSDTAYVPGGAGFKALTGLTITGNDFQQTVSPRLLVHGNPYDGQTELWEDNQYWDDSPSSGWFSLGGVEKSFDEWQGGIEPDANRTQRRYRDPNRTVGTYNRSLGGGATLESFIADARKQSRQNWRPQLTAAAVNDYMRQGFTVDSSVPTAGLEAADVNTLGGAGQAFIIHYADDEGIDPRTLDSADIRVTGPNGFSQLASLIGVDRAGTTTRAAVYAITAPGGIWSEASAGLYTVTAESGQVGDLLGNALPPGVVGSFRVRSDTEAPSASALAGPVTVSGGTTHTVTVTYADNDAIDAASIGAGDILITGPGGFEQFATLVSVDSADDGAQRIATYSFAAPDGAWDAADNGTYAVVLRPDEVRDISGNYHPGGTLTTFEVGVAGAAAATTRISAMSVTSAGAMSHTFTVAYEGDSGSAAVAGAPDVYVTGPSAFHQPAAVESVQTVSGGRVTVVTYSVPAPGGRWDAADSGRYTIRRPFAPATQGEPGAPLLPGAAMGSFNVRIARSDFTPPKVVAAGFSARFDDKVSLRFTEDVSASLAAGDFEIKRVGRETFSPARLKLRYDRRANRAILTFDGAGAGEIGAGLYKLVLRSSGVFDGAGNKLEGNGDGAAFVMYFRKS